MGTYLASLAALKSHVFLCLVNSCGLMSLKSLRFGMIIPVDKRESPTPSNLAFVLAMLAWRRRFPYGFLGSCFEVVLQANHSILKNGGAEQGCLCLAFWLALCIISVYLGLSVFDHYELPQNPFVNPWRSRFRQLFSSDCWRMNLAYACHSQAQTSAKSVSWSPCQRSSSLKWAAKAHTSQNDSRREMYGNVWKASISMLKWIFRDKLVFVLYSFSSLLPFLLDLWR